MKKIMISFIIPTYNSSQTIERTINSILNQNEKSIDYEIIVIDDGSIDNLDNIMKKYCNEIKVKYYKKENSGVADTRNYGVNKANGEYIIFVDSDDYIKETLLYDIKPYIDKKIDLIKWNVIFVDENENDILYPISVNFDTVTGEEGFNLLFGNDNLIDCLWKYAFKKEILVEFPKGRYHEDFATIPLIIVKANSFVSIKEREYYYVQSQNSIMRNSNIKIEEKKIEDKLYHFDNLINTSKYLKIQDYTKENIQIFAVNSMLTVLHDLKGKEKKNYEKELKARKIGQYIKPRNLKQLIKKVLISIKYS